MHSTDTPGVIGKGFRSLMAFLDKTVYKLLGIVYIVFFNVASVQILSGATMAKFFSRIQIIIGVYMIFRITISIFNGIVNPDGLMSGKDENGVSKMVTRIVISLIMLTMIMPISIPDPKNDWEKQINNSGLLFGTLYELQDRLLENNTIGKLILGTKASSDETGNQIAKLGDIFAADVIKTFFSPNMTEAASKTGNPDVDVAENWQCGNHNDFEKWYKAYVESKNTDKLLAMATDNCKNNGKHYAFYYMFLMPTIVGIAFIFILVFFTVDVAIRVIKLAILRLLAPIPIISYIDPKSQKDGAFANWVKNLISTYLDLFLRLAVIFFVLFIIQGIARDGLTVPNAPNILVSGISKIFIFIGLFFFAKQAPGFIKNVLGVKGGSGSIGLNGLLGGTAALIGGAGLAGAAAATMKNMDATSEAASQGKAAPPAWSAGRDLAAQLKTGDSKSRGGILNGFTDRAMRSAGISRAKKYGVTAKGIEDAKGRMYKEENNLEQRKDLYDRFNRGELTAQEKENLANTYGGSFDSQTGKLNLDADQQERARAGLRKSVEDQKKIYGKAKSNYDSANKFGDSHRISASFEEEHRASRLERVPIVGEGIAKSMYKARGGQKISRNETDHVSGADRIVGKNRWEPDYTGGVSESSTLTDSTSSTNRQVGQDD